MILQIFIMKFFIFIQAVVYLVFKYEFSIFIFISNHLPITHMQYLAGMVMIKKFCNADPVQTFR